VLSQLAQALLLEMEHAREADRLYWRPILAELRDLQRRRQLLHEGDNLVVLTNSALACPAPR
jgi:hypothetical protein